MSFGFALLFRCLYISIIIWLRYPLSILVVLIFKCHSYLIIFCYCGIFITNTLKTYQASPIHPNFTFLHCFHFIYSQWKQPCNGQSKLHGCTGIHTITSMAFTDELSIKIFILSYCTCLYYITQKENVQTVVYNTNKMNKYKCTTD